MTQEKIQKIIAEALPRTSAKEAEISFVVSDIEDPTTWVVVLDAQGEELAVKISERPDSSPETIRNEFIDQVRRLF